MFLVDIFLWPGGRIRRTTYWLGLLGLSVAAVIVLIALLPVLSRGAYSRDQALAFVWLPFAYPYFVLCVKRWHDRDKSAWWFLLPLVPIIGPLWSFVELGFLGGTDGWNRFGEDPRNY